MPIIFAGMLVGCANQGHKEPRENVIPQEHPGNTERETVMNTTGQPLLYSIGSSR